MSKPLNYIQWSMYPAPGEPCAIIQVAEGPPGASRAPIIWLGKTKPDEAVFGDTWESSKGRFTLTVEGWTQT